MDKNELIKEASSLVKSVLGKCNEDAVAVLLKAQHRMYDEKKLKEKLLDEGLDAKKAGKLAAKAVDSLLKSRKRKKFEEFPDAKPATLSENGANGKADKAHKAAVPDKKPKLEGKDAADQLRVKQVMAEAQRNIEEAKKRLKIAPKPLPVIIKSGNYFDPTPLMPNSMISQPSLAPDEASQFMAQALDKAKRRAELSARIANRLPGAIGDVTIKPKPIGIDAAGRAVDAKTGEALTMIGRQPTLKANLKESLGVKAEVVLEKDPPKPAPVEAEASTNYVDPRVSIRGAGRQRRGFRWGEKGEYEALANRQRAKAKLDLLQSEISQASKKTGISSAVKLAMVAPKASELQRVEVPDTEWWDAYLIPDEAGYPDTADDDGLLPNLPKETTKLISALVEHPIQLKPPTEPVHAQYLKVYLTKKEKQKLRRQNRRELQREQQEKVRLGMAAPPEPKVKLTNLMRVLGQEAIQDPTKMEAQVKLQMAARQRKHEDANAARKLSKEQRAEKKTKKLQEDTSLGVHVSVYRVADLSKQGNKFKVEMNAKQMQMSGIVILHKDVNVVVVEGGPKQQKFFKNLMLKRIKWDKSEEGSRPAIVVWEGLVKHRNFGEIRFKACPLEKQAREFFHKFGVPQYWDLAFNGSVLSQDADNVL